MKRANTNKDKEKRARLILDNAYRLLKEKSYDEITIASIAKLCNISKGTIFNYYKTKETLFYKLIHRYFLRVYVEFKNTFNSVKGKITVDEFIKLIIKFDTETFDMNSGYLKLLPIKSTILEANISLELKEEMKKFATENYQDIINIIYSKVKNIKKEDLTSYFIAQNIIKVGFITMHLSYESFKEIEGFINSDSKSLLIITLENLLIGTFKKEG